MTPTKRLARIAGFFYLLVAIFGGFAEGFVEPKMYVAGNAAATAGNVVAQLRAGPHGRGRRPARRRRSSSSPPSRSTSLLKDVHKSAATGDARLRRARCRASPASVRCSSSRDCASRPARSTRRRSVSAVRMRWCCSCSMPSTTASSPRRSSSASGWRRSGTSPTSRGGFPRRWVWHSSSPAAATSWTCSPRSSPQASTRRSTPLIVIPCAVAELWMVVYLRDRRRQDCEARAPRPCCAAGELSRGPSLSSCWISPVGTHRSGFSVSQQLDHYPIAAPSIDVPSSRSSKASNVSSSAGVRPAKDRATTPSTILPPATRNSRPFAVNR